MLNYAEEREVNILRSKQKPAEFGVEKLKPTIEPKETRRCQESESKETQTLRQRCLSQTKGRRGLGRRKVKPYAKSAR